MISKCISIESARDCSLFQCFYVLFAGSKSFSGVKRIILVLLVFLIFQSCADVMQDDCGVDNPVEDLEWLKLQTENVPKESFVFLVRGRYKGRTVFFFDVCNRFWPSLHVISDCRGELMEDASVNDIVEQEVIWRPEGSKCGFD